MPFENAAYISGSSHNCMLQRTGEDGFIRNVSKAYEFQAQYCKFKTHILIGKIATFDNGIHWISHAINCTGVESLYSTVLFTTILFISSTR